VLSWAHPSPQPKQHLDCLSRFCTAQAERPYTLQWAALPPQNCPFQWGHLDHLAHWIIWLIEARNPNGIWIGSAVFAQLTIVSVYFTMGHPFPQETMY